ncbi:MAG TPA: VapE domain-containing protein [Hanamia sp.]|nr:VapE domain-containing protein [Hanamia sp.]
MITREGFDMLRDRMIKPEFCHPEQVEVAFKNFLNSYNHPFDKPLQFDTPGFNYCACPHSSNRSNQDLRYKIFSDGVPSGYFKCWHCDVEADFTFKQQHEVSHDEWRAHRKRLAQRKLEDEKRIKQAQNEASKTAQEMWDRATPCVSHDYLELKQVKSFGLRIRNDGTLLVPCLNAEGTLINLERIYFDKQTNKFQKRPLKGGQRIGAFYTIGELKSPEDVIYIAEGYSTAATIFESTNIYTIVSFNCGNLQHVAKIIRKLYPQAKIVIAADRDESRAGEEHAKKAIALIGENCEYVLPDFSILHLSQEELSKLTDFNDLACAMLNARFERKAAHDEVKRQVLKQNKNKEDSMLSEDIGTNSKKSSENVQISNVVKLKMPITFPELNQHGKPLNTYGNLKHLLDILGINVRWNDMSRIREVTLPNFKIFYDDEENSALREVTNLAEIYGLPTTKIDDHLASIAQQNHYHPIVECIKSKPWDGEKRLEKFIKTVKTSNDDFSHKLIHRWMKQAVAAAFAKEGFASHGVLVFQGKQYIGKTSWVKSLDPLNRGAIRNSPIKEGMLLDPANKDSVITCASHWIVELGELDATFKKADIARIKSYVTSQIDIVRFPHARKNSRLPRRTVFFASVNESEYLIDDTGNRRWWTIEVESIDLNHGFDMQQVWAEVYQLWLEDPKISLSQEELNSLNNLNAEHEQIDPFEEKVKTYFDWSEGWQKYNTQEMTATEVLETIGFIKGAPSKRECMRMSKILTKLTGEKPKRKTDGRYHTLPRHRPFVSDTS